MDRAACLKGRSARIAPLDPTAPLVPRLCHSLTPPVFDEAEDRNGYARQSVNSLLTILLAGSLLTLRVTFVCGSGGEQLLDFCVVHAIERPHVSVIAVILFQDKIAFNGNWPNGVAGAAASF